MPKSCRALSLPRPGPLARRQGIDADQGVPSDGLGGNLAGTQSPAIMFESATRTDAQFCHSRSEGDANSRLHLFATKRSRTKCRSMPGVVAGRGLRRSPEHRATGQRFGLWASWRTRSRVLAVEVEGKTADANEGGQGQGFVERHVERSPDSRRMDYSGYSAGSAGSSPDCEQDAATATRSVDVVFASSNAVIWEMK